MNKLILEPTAQNIEGYKKVQNNEVYWLTADFFLFDRRLEEELSVIFDAYVEAVMEDDKEDEDEELRRIGFSIGRRIVKAARKAGLSPQDYRDHFNNYATVIFTPICIWQKGESGEIRYSLMSNLPKG